METFQITSRPTIHCRQSCAYICINGKAYKLIHASMRFRHDVKPNEARLIPLDAIDQNVRVVFAAYNEENGQEEVGIIRLNFHRPFGVRDIFNMERTTIYAMRTNHNSAVRQRRRNIPLQESRMVQAAQDDQTACYICFQNIPDAKFTSCEHAELCCACAYRITQSTKKCPLCRGEVTSFQRIVQ